MFRGRISPPSRVGATTRSTMSTALIRLLAIALACAGVAYAGAQSPAASLSIGGRSLLHAHNCYPEDGQWQDRIDRALAVGKSPFAVEQDVAWSPGSAGRPGRSVVSHDREVSGAEPTLEAHFFDRVRPLMERALAERQTDKWPLLVLHLDFKTNEPEHHRAVWDCSAASARRQVRRCRLPTIRTRAPRWRRRHPRRRWCRGPPPTTVAGLTSPGM